MFNRGFMRVRTPGAWLPNVQTAWDEVKCGSGSVCWS